MILNSGRHTQSDPQSCRVRSLGGRRGGPENKQSIKRPKTKLSSAMPDHDKTIHCQGKRRKRHPASNVAAESAPHPRHAVKACANDRTIPNNMVRLGKVFLSLNKDRSFIDPILSQMKCGKFHKLKIPS